MMKRKTSSVFVLLILLAAGGFFFLARSNDQGARLENLLRDVSIKNLEVDGKTFQLNGGKVEPKADRGTTLKVLRLSAFYQWNKEDPLFDSPDLDVERLATVTDKLKTEADGLQKALGVENSIYPIAFLQNLPKVAALDRDFFEKPSLGKAREVAVKQEETASFYGSGADSLLQYISKDALNANATTFNIQTSGKRITADIAVIGKNKQALLDEIGRRKACLEGSGKCQRPAFAFEKVENKVFEPPESVPQFLDLVWIFQYFNRHPNVDASIYDGVKGPYRANTACFGWGDNFSEPENYFYVNFSSKSKSKFGVDSAFVELATNVYFRNESGKYTYVRSTLIYFCPETGYVDEVLEISKFLSENKPVLKTDKFEGAPEVFSQGREYESKFFEGKYQSWDQLETLGKYYGYLYRLFVENPSVFWSQNLELKGELLKRSLAIERKLGDFPKDFQRILTHTQGERLRERPQGVDEGQRKFVYTFRNYYGFTFLPFTKSVWRSTDNLQYADKEVVSGAVGEEGGFLDYLTARKKFSPDVIKSWYAKVQP